MIGEIVATKFVFGLSVIFLFCSTSFSLEIEEEKNDDINSIENKEKWPRHDPIEELGLSELFNSQSQFINPYFYFFNPTVTAAKGRQNNRRTLDLCYYLGDDILKSHIAYNPIWADSTPAGIKRYINEMTLQANKIIGLHNLRLVWKGPFQRSDKHNRYPENIDYDTKVAANRYCDAVIYMVFNDYSNGAPTNGHKYSGFADGAVCDAPVGKGYAVVVDQGYLENVWMGPQVLAHHLLLLLTSDLNDAGGIHCPDSQSLLNSQILPGAQRMDQCVVDKLNRSGISRRPCMQD